MGRSRVETKSDLPPNTLDNRPNCRHIHMLDLYGVRIIRFFLWLSVLGNGVALGAKLFDLVVVVGAWSTAPPASLALLPYGPHYRIDPGGFFCRFRYSISSACSELISGWKTSLQFRVWLWLPVVIFLIIWALTPTAFWPMNHQLYLAAQGASDLSTAEVIRMTRR